MENYEQVPGFHKHEFCQRIMRDGNSAGVGGILVRLRGMGDAVEPYQLDRLGGGGWGRAVASDGKEVVRNSARRYIEHITG